MKLKLSLAIIILSLLLACNKDNQTNNNQDGCIIANENYFDFQNIINLSQKNIKDLPVCLWNLSGVENLNLSFNNLSIISDSISKLSKLTTLNICANSLITIPESIGSLTNLEGLYLEGNKLNSIPESIGNLIKLRQLALADNQLSTLPESLKNLAGVLIQLTLEQNNFSDAEKEKIKKWLPNTEISWQ
jgi:Leucine-rich repeat (LRR) protein